MPVPHRLTYLIPFPMKTHLPAFTRYPEPLIQSLSHVSLALRPLRRSILPLTLALGLLISAVPMPVLAQTFIPPNRGMPGRREGGGTRGCWGNTTTNFSTRLTALVPAQNFGYTLDEYPSFFIYVPDFFAEKAIAAEFILSTADDEVVYQVIYETTVTDGLVKITLPADANVAPLELGQDYNWSFSLICNQDDRSADLVVDSWIQRIEPSANLVAQLEGASSEDRPGLLAEAGIWYSSLDSLVALAEPQGRISNVPGWGALLDSVGLSAIAQHLTTETTSDRPNVSPVVSPDVAQ